MSGPDKVTSRPVNIQQQPVIINSQPQPANRQEEVKTKIKELQALVKGSSPETMAVANILTVNQILPHSMPGGTPVASLINLATVVLLNSSEAEKQAAARIMNEHFKSQFQAINQAALISSYRGENKENKLPPRIDIEFSRNILIDLQEEIETLVSTTSGFTGDIQKEIGKYKMTNDLREKNYKIEVLKKCVKEHFKTHAQLHDLAIDQLTLIEEKKIRIEGIKIILNNCIEELMKLNTKDFENMDRILKKIQTNIRGAYEIGKYKRENWFQHSQCFELPEKSKSYVSDSMHLEESSVYQFLNENLEQYKNIKKFIDDATIIGKNVLWVKEDPHTEEAEEHAKAFPETYKDLSKRYTDICDKLEEHDKKLALVQNYVTQFLSKKLEGLVENEKTIMDQSNSLLTECENLDKAINETAIHQYFPITNESKVKYTEMKYSELASQL